MLSLAEINTDWGGGMLGKVQTQINVKHNIHFLFWEESRMVLRSHALKVLVVFATGSPRDSEARGMTGYVPFLRSMALVEHNKDPESQAYAMINDF